MADMGTDFIPTYTVKTVTAAVNALGQKALVFVTEEPPGKVAIHLPDAAIQILLDKLAKLQAASMTGGSA